MSQFTLRPIWAWRCQMTNHTAIFEHALRSGSRDKVFYALVTHPTMPLTDAELMKLVALNPIRWGPYAKYIGFLDDQREMVAQKTKAA